ncbi:DUF2062 domain-containing protein [Alphaproteobacteria bacterium]|nr:DUF2062 domain-containing protein [Alphaproteobacteria bacterium]
MFKRRNPLTVIQRLRQFFWPREGWKRATVYLWRRTVRLQGSPHNIALGLAVGGFISANPLLGTHIIWAGIIVYFLGGNFLAAVAGTWVGNPITFPFIWLSTYSTGSWLMGARGSISEMPEISFGQIIQTPLELLQPVILPMLIGSVPVGLLLGVATYYPSLLGVRVYQKRRAIRLEKKRLKMIMKNEKRN